VLVRLFNLGLLAAGKRQRNHRAVFP